MSRVSIDEFDHHGNLRNGNVGCVKAWLFRANIGRPSTAGAPPAGMRAARLPMRERKKG